MKALHYLSLFCLLLPGCVSEQWVRGYVQHEMAGVKDIVTEEVYPLEKAVMDLKTQIASVIVEQKEVNDELKAVKAAVTVDDKKWEEMGQKIAGLEKDLKRVEVSIEDLQSALGGHPDLAQTQTGTETVSKGSEPTQGKEKLLQKP